MPKRPRKHVIEDIARARLHRDFSNIGWTVEDLDRDYGEDLLVWIFERENATPWSFYVQSKATDRIDTLLMKDGRNVAFSITSQHAQHWERFWEPVVLAIYDSKSDVTYWEIIQSYLESTRGLCVDDPRKTVTIHVPTDNLLDEEGLLRLRNITKSRFERFEAQKEGAQVLIEELRRQWKVDIEYDPEWGYLELPKGKFLTDKSGNSTITAFGRFASQFQRMEKKHGINPKLAFEGSIELIHKIVSAYKEGAKLQVLRKNGVVVQEFETLEDLLRHARRKQELDEE